MRTALFEQRKNGYWEGQLSASALSTATAISALSMYLAEGSASSDQRSQIESQIQSGLNWMVGQQNPDGGWGDTDLSYSNISTTMLVIAAIHAAGLQDQYRDLIDAGQAYVDSQGAIPVDTF